MIHADNSTFFNDAATRAAHNSGELISESESTVSAEDSDHEAEIERYIQSLHAKLPKALSKFPSILTTLLVTSEALALTDSLHVYDYTYIAFDALKSLECAMQLILSEYDIVIDPPAHLSFGQVFDVTNDTYEVVDGRRRKLINYSPEFECTLAALDDDGRRIMTDCYNFYCKTRHKHFHSSQNIAEMSYIDSREKAIDIVEEAYAFIEALADLL